jgi:glutathione S-transferase
LCAGSRRRQGKSVRGRSQLGCIILFKVSSIEIERAHQKAAYILSQLNQHLSQRTWLEFERLTIADVAVFPYVALSPDGRLDLSAYPHVLAWIERIKHLPGFVGMIGIDSPVAV